MLGRRMDTEPSYWEGGMDYDNYPSALVSQQATQVAESIGNAPISESTILEILANGMTESGEWSLNDASNVSNNVILPSAFYATLAEEYNIEPTDVLEHIKNTRRLGYPLTPNTDPADVQRAMGQTEQWRQRNMDLANEHTGADRDRRNATETWDQNRQEIERRDLETSAINVDENARIRNFEAQVEGVRSMAANFMQQANATAKGGIITKHIKELNAKVNSKAAKKVGIAPESEYRNYVSLVPSLFYRQGDQVLRKLANAWSELEEAEPGQVFAGASSLSGDSYRAVLWFMNKYGFGTKKNPKHMLSTEWHGWDTLNDSEFARSAGIPHSVTINEINDYMKKMNHKLPHGQKMPYAYKRGEDIYVPRLTFKRLDNTPDKKMGGTIYDKYDKTLFIYQMGGSITDKEKQHLLTGYGITLSPEPGEIKIDEESIQIDGEHIHKELALDIYKNYIHGSYANSSQEEKAVKVYDKVNRKYYKEAKNAGMSVGNYVLSKVIQEGIYS